MRYFLIACVTVLLLSACQNSATGNRDTSLNGGSATLKYPLKTGQRDIFVYEDITTSPSSFYNDDGAVQKGYGRAFNNLGDGTVYNTNYNLYWQDNNATEEYNLTAAQNSCQALSLVGKTDWRLPNVYELVTLLDLDSRTNLRESSFDNMPNGYYFSSQTVNGTEQTIVVGFGENDFNVTKVDKVRNVDINDSIYGTQVGVSQVPKYSSKGVLLYVTKDVTYYDSTGTPPLLTTISTVTRYDENGTVIGIDGPYIVQEIPLHPPVVKPVIKTYIKCVSGPEIKGFNFVRDVRNEVVVDTATTLMWQDDKYVVQNNHKWGEANKYCTNLQLGGYKDWRLPTVSEIITINDFSDNGTYSVDSTFIYRSANRFHTSSDSCYGLYCHQKNYQFNACGFLDEKVIENFEIDTNPYDNNRSEPYYKTRCVRGGSY